MSSLISVLHKVALSSVWCVWIIAVGFMGTHLHRAYQEYRHILWREQEQSHRLEQLRHAQQQQQAYLQHLLTDEEFFEHVVKQHMGYLHNEEILFRFENTPTNL